MSRESEAYGREVGELITSRWWNPDPKKWPVLDHLKVHPQAINFVRQEGNQMAEIRAIHTHKGDFMFRVDHRAISGRLTVLLNYLNDAPPASLNDTATAKGTLGEIFFRDSLDRYLASRGLADEGVGAIFAPIDFEKSVRPSEGVELRKGGDILLTRERMGILDPLLLIDVSMQDIKALWQHDHKTVSGINGIVPTYAVTIALESLRLRAGNRGYRMRNFLDQVVKPSIQEGNYDPFASMSEDEMELYFLSLGGQLYNHLFSRYSLIEAARSLEQRGKPLRGLSSYGSKPYLRIGKQLDFLMDTLEKDHTAYTQLTQNPDVFRPAEHIRTARIVRSIEAFREFRKNRREK